MKTQEEVVRRYAVGPINIYRIYQEGYQDRELDDWSSFRREAAKDILAGMMSNIPLSEYGINDAECMAEYAVLYAEKLIKQLKQE